jgi:hypothetical protein
MTLYAHYSLRTEVVGESGAQCFSKNKEERLEFRKLEAFDLRKPDSIPKYSVLYCDAEAILSDFMLAPSDIGVMDLLVSKRAMAYLKKVNPQKADYYKIKIEHEKSGKSYDYFWVHMIEDLKPHIDFKNSEFSVLKIGAKDKALTDISIESLEDFYLKKDMLFKENVMLSILITKLKWTKDSKAAEYDFLLLGGMDRLGYFISNKFLDIIKKQELTGFDVYSDILCNSIVYQSLEGIKAR